MEEVEEILTDSRQTHMDVSGYHLIFISNLDIITIKDLSLLSSDQSC